MTPRELVDVLPTRIDPHGLARPLVTSYRARVALGDPQPPLLAASKGRAKIEADARPLLHQWLRTLSQTFRFRND
jgi:hypothetical protein